MKKISCLLLVLFVLLSVLLMTGCVINTTNSDLSSNKPEKEKKTYGLEEKFVFNDLELRLGKNISFVTIDNIFDENNGKTVIKVPITIKNLKNESQTLSSWDYKVFNPSEVETKTYGYYFDESVEEAGDLRPNASYTKYIYILYEGNGKYIIEFDDWFYEKVEAEFEIKK